METRNTRFLQTGRIYFNTSETYVILTTIQPIIIRLYLMEDQAKYKKRDKNENHNNINVRNTINLKHFSTLLLLGVLILLSTQTLFASDKYSGISGFDIELGCRSKSGDRAMGGGIGLFGYPSDYFSVHGRLSFLGSDGLDDYFGGADIGLRCGFGKRVSPFIGLGFFAGYAKEDVSADKDNQDNDDDGYIDERGEEKEIIKDVIASIYPEVGLYYWVDDHLRLSFSGKYHITTKAREHDFWLFNIGLSLGFY